MRTWIVLSLVLGCQTMLGIEDLRGGPQPIEYASTECSECVAKSCAAPRSQCALDRSCDRVLRCAARCPVNKPACRADCERQAVGGQAPPSFIAYDDCVRRSCLPSCVGDRGLCTTLSESCRCLDDACAAESAACIAGSSDTNVGACERTYMCIVESKLTPDGTMSCYARGRPSKEVDAFRSCWLGKTCPGCDLAAGNVYQCARKYKWREPQEGVVNFSGSVVSITRRPLADVTVRACSVPTCDCTDSPSATTDADGKFVMPPLETKRRYGCFEVSGAGVRTTDVYLGRPIQRSESDAELLVAAEGDIESLAVAIPDVLLEGRAHVIVAALDCVFTRAQGVEVALDRADGATRFYLSATGLDKNATVTFARGVAGFLNVPVDGNVIRVRHAGTEVTALPIVARAGHVLLVPALPSPE